MPDAESDVVVIGAGHNALISAAYLAKAGLSVTVLEARDTIGGGTVTEELAGPGFRHDTFSTGHPWLFTNPVITSDELGIIRNGLSYVGHDPILVVPFPDGESITVWRDKHRTAAEIARFSKKDAQAWLQLYDEWAPLAPLLRLRSVHTADQIPAVEDKRLEEKYFELMRKSAWDVVHERFESEHVRGMLLWFGMVVVQPIDQPGTGVLPLSVPVGWSEYGWMNAVGGSLRLAESLAAAVRAHGGRVLTGARVSKIMVQNGRATGVQAEDGTTYGARKAIVSSMHFTSLPKTLAAPLPKDFVRGVENWRSGPSLFVVYLALPENHRVRTYDGSIAAVLAGQSMVGGVGQQLKNVVAEKLTTHEPWMFVACSTWIDPSRAPEGRGTLKMTTFAPYALDGDPMNWDRVKAEYTDFLVAEYSKLVVGFKPGDELARSSKSPLDIERTNGSYHRGAAQGGEMVPDQMGLNRPVKGWANYRMPISGLYQTGTSTHPGGPVSGWPGRHAARAVLEDLQVDCRKIMPDPNASHRYDIPVIDTSRF